MKNTILECFSGFMETTNPDEKEELKNKLVDLIEKASINLDAATEVHNKKLIIATLNRYAETSDEALKIALIEHYKTLESFL